MTASSSDLASADHEMQEEKKENEGPKPVMSPTGACLTQARRILWKGHPPKILQWFLGPLRIFLLDPLLAVLVILVPLLLPRKVDEILALVLLECLALPVLRQLYIPRQSSSTDNMARSLFGGSATDDEAALQRATRQSILFQPTVVTIHPPTSLQSAFQGGVSFVISTIGDIAGILANPEKLTGWMRALRQFNTFLESTGVGSELVDAIQKPLLHGRLLDNVNILSDIQAQLHLDHNRVLDWKNQTDESTTTQAMRQDIHRGHRLMRFATAAYGTDMIRSALDQHVNAAEFIEKQQEDPWHAIALHTQLPPEDIQFVYAQNENEYEKHVLHHYVAIDHQKQSIVLAIRGTLSLSGAIVDMQGMAADYCSGKAHKGISEMAANLWKESGDKITALLRQHEDYKLMVTGHSLGAGTACLLTLQLYVEDILPGRIIECFAFAPPPTFFHASSSDQSDSSSCACRIDQAIQNTVAFIHDNDVVPFLSISAVRRMVHLLDAVDEHTEHIWFWKRWRIFNDYEDVPDVITKSVSTVAERGAVEGEFNMAIPARHIVWCKEDFLGRFEAYSCDPEKVAKGNIFMSKDMLSDHLPEQYENALDALILSN